MLPLSDLDSREKFGQFADERIAPYAQATDVTGALHVECLRAFREERYLGTVLPAAYGGLGLDPLNYGLLTAEVGRACSSSRTLLTVHDIVSWTISRWGSTDLKRSLLPELAHGTKLAAFALSEFDAGSDPSRLSTSVRRAGSDLVINGVKAWISYGMIADLILVFGRMDDGLAAVIVPAVSAGIRREPVGSMVGTRGAMMANLHFEECLVPAEALIGRPGFGLSHVAQTALDLGRYSVAWGAVGIIEAALASCRAYVRDRNVSGGRLSEQPLMQAHFARMMCLSRAARLMCLEAGRMRTARSPEALEQTLVAKYFAAKCAVEVTNLAVHIHGASGLCESHAPQRLLRDAKVTELIEGSAEILELLIGRMSI